MAFIISPYAAGGVNTQKNLIRVGLWGYAKIILGTPERHFSESFPIFEVLLFDFLGVLVFLLSLFVFEVDNLFVVIMFLAVVIVMVMLHDMDGNRI